MIIEAREVWLKDGEKLILRSALEKDVAAILECVRTITRESYRNMNAGLERWETFTAEKEAEILKTFAEGEKKFFLAAFTQDGTVVATLTAAPASTSAFVSHNVAIGMGCISKYQNRGLGNQLLRTAIFEAQKLKFHRIELSVRTFNKPAIALYEKCGFQKVGTAHEIAFIDGQYADEHLYELILK